MIVIQYVTGTAFVYCICTSRMMCSLQVNSGLAFKVI